MKKILSLLLLSSSAFAMELDIVRSEPSMLAMELGIKHTQYTQSLDMVQLQQKASVVKTLLKDTHISAPSVFVPARLGELELFHGKKGFSVLKDDQRYAIEKYNTDRLVRNMTKEELISFLAVGYVSINQMSDGEYSLKANGRINGGGPVLGTVMYWVTKSVCYGVAAVGIGAAAVSTAGVGVAAVTGAGAAVAGGAAVTAGAAAGAGAGIATTAGVVLTGGAAAVTGGATAVAGGIAVASATGATVAGVSVGTAAAMTTAVGVTTAAGTGAAATIGTGAACVAAIESASLAVGTFFGMLPTP